MTIELNHSFKIKKQPHRSYKLDFSRIRDMSDLTLILGTLNIQISVPGKIDESQYAAIENFLIEQ